MAKKSARPEEQPAARSPKNKERQGPGFTAKAIRMAEVYAEWLERFAKRRRITVAALFDQSLADAARAHGFEAPPERLP